MRVLVCGGRNYEDFDAVNKQLTWIAGNEGITEIIHGAARGADRMADEWAQVNGVPCRVYPALWKEHGKAAGPIRNQLMIDDAKPDLVVAFPGGRGTADMVRRAKTAGIKVIEV